MLLSLKDVNVFYGGIHALKGVNIEVQEGSFVTLIGANGAGKTTTLRAIMGLVGVKEGRIIFDGKDITDLPTHERVKKGLVLVPEGRRVFANLTVEENLVMGGFFLDEEERRRRMEKIYGIFPRLKERKWQEAGTLSGGEQQMLAIGRAMMASPKLLMLDEPSLGLAPKVVHDVFEIIREIHDSGTTILLVEQNAHMALAYSDYAYVLDTGKIILEGPSKMLEKNEMVIEAYLGGV